MVDAECREMERSGGLGTPTSSRLPGWRRIDTCRTTAMTTRRRRKKGQRRGEAATEADTERGAELVRVENGRGVWRGGGSVTMRG